jgi:hypothetical protein
MYENAKMIPAEIVPGIRGERRAVEGVNSDMMYLLHCKYIYRCTPTQHNNQKKKRTGGGCQNRQR